MINDFTHYVLLVIVNFFDVGLAYFIICNLIMPRPDFLIKEVENKHPPLSMKIIGMGIAYGVVYGYFGYLFQESLIFRTIGIVVIVGLIKFFTKDKVRNAIIIYALTFLVVIAIQTPIGIILRLLAVPDIYTALILVSCGFFIAYVLYQKVGLHKPFVFIKRSFGSFKIIVLFLASIFFSLAGFYLFWNSHYQWFISLLIVTIIVVGLYQSIIYIMGLQARFHNLNNLLEGIEYLLMTEEETNEIYKHYEETLKSNGFKISKCYTYELGKHKENLIEFIKHKKKSHQSKAEFITDIKFYYRNNKVPIPVLIQMLGTLLDNALETKTNKPILVDMLVTGSQLEITVSNASDHKSPIEIDQMFSEGSSTKKGEHGYGLSTLARTVKSYGGIIIADCDYNTTHKSYYLALKLEFKDCHKKS